MLYCTKKYPVSLVVIPTVIYLSFFKPPTTEPGTIPNLDRVVYICIYFGMPRMLWLEFPRIHREGYTPMRYTRVGAFICPMSFSGIMELLQECCITYRGGDWPDLVVNTTEVVLAPLAAYLALRP